MEYYAPMHTVVETPGYLRDASAIFTAKEREEIVTSVATDPECGEVMQGTGGVRKVQVGRGGKARVAVHEWSTFTTTLTIQCFCLRPSLRTKRATSVSPNGMS